MIKDLWYKNAVIYCLDVATYMDSDGDGIGDFRGLTHAQGSARDRPAARTAAVGTVFCSRATAIVGTGSAGSITCWCALKWRLQPRTRGSGLSRRKRRPSPATNARRFQRLWPRRLGDLLTFARELIHPAARDSIVVLRTLGCESRFPGPSFRRARAVVRRVRFSGSLG